MGDMHFGHENISRYRPFPSETAHREFLMGRWCDEVRSRRDVVYVLGDAAFTVDGLMSIDALPGRKILIRGNHDTLSTQMYLSVFEEVHGLWPYKRKVWLSHAPLHPAELRGRLCVHGHCHAGGPDEPGFFNACPEFTGWGPVSLRSIVDAWEAGP